MSDDTPTSKYCPDCGSKQPIEAFYRSRVKGTERYRYSPYCKTHMKARTAAAAKAAPEGSKTREANRRASQAWKQRHPEKQRAYLVAHRARKKAQADADGAAQRRSRQRRRSSVDEPPGSSDDQAG